MGKVLSEAERAYIAGLIDADGAIMALIERHKEKKFKFRVRVAMKLTQKKPEILRWLSKKLQAGDIKRNRATFDWITRDQKEIKRLLRLLYPFLRIKKKQAKVALKILDVSIRDKKDLMKVARLADTLALNNPRSRERRKNFSLMIEENTSPND